MNSLLDLVKFCRTRGTPKLRKTRPISLIGYLGWAMHSGYSIIATHDGEISGVGIAWEVRDLGNDPAAYGSGWKPMEEQEEHSGLLYVANLAADDSESLRSILDAASDRWPSTQRFLGHRQRGRSERLVIYPWHAAPKLYALAHET